MTTYSAALLQTALSQAVPANMPADAITAINACATTILNALEAADQAGIPALLLSSLLDAEKFVVWSSVEDVVNATNTALPTGPLDPTETAFQSQLAAAQATLDSLQNSVRLYEAAKAAAAAPAPSAPTPPAAPQASPAPTAATTTSAPPAPAASTN